MKLLFNEKSKDVDEKGGKTVTAPAMVSRIIREMKKSLLMSAAEVKKELELQMSRYARDLDNVI
ncbi:unnamed protein product [Ceratitis capitata]|uniref:(Mediterranean fruit fly) hypothetical protein n=1 Tax=Ceratitis capitata TaxID=7213 RepID=A0A811V5A7_CERCA|nr:unnamed protein product [Ceratitis capitata]